MTTENATPAVPATTKSSPRSLAADHPRLMRGGIITFGVGVVISMIFGIATNVFPQQAQVLESYQRGGLAVMLAGMVLILFCFPNARRMLSLPRNALQSINGASDAARLIALHCGLVLGSLILAAVCNVNFRTIPVVAIHSVLIAILLVWITTVPRACRPYFLAALVPSVLSVMGDYAAYFVSASLMRLVGWSQPPIDHLSWQVFALAGSIPLGFIGLGAAWVARKVGGEEDA